MASEAAALRRAVLNQYKNFMYLARDYPAGEQYFRDRAKKAFVKNSALSDPAEIRKALDRGEFVIKEVEALYALRKYRTLRARYSDEEQARVAVSSIEELK